MLVGTYPMSVDSKGRVTLPASFRKELTSDVSKKILLVPLGNSVLGFSPEGFKDYIESLFADGYDPRNPRDRNLRNGITRRAVDVDLDAGGRIALGKLDVRDPETRKKYGLLEDVVITGNTDHFEVFSPEQYQAEEADFEDNFESLLDR